MVDKVSDRERLQIIASRRLCLTDDWESDSCTRLVREGCWTNVACKLLSRPLSHACREIGSQALSQVYRVFIGSVPTLVAFHPRPQIASDLGRNVTRSFNPHRNRNQFPSGNEILAYGRRFKSQSASTRCDLRIASPTRPFLQVIWTAQIANPQAAIAELGPPGGRKSQNRRPQGHEGPNNPWP